MGDKLKKQGLLLDTNSSIDFCKVYALEEINMETLRIFGVEEKEEIGFDEVLNTYGDWKGPTIKVDKDKFKKLNYKSDSHDYYIFESDAGVHTLYRNKI